MASDAIFKYLNSHLSRARWVIKTYEVSFFTNFGFADLIEWYSLYFGYALDFQIQRLWPKMAADAIMKTRKSDLSWYKLDRKANEVSSPANSGITYVIEWFLLCSDTSWHSKPKWLPQNGHWRYIEKQKQCISIFHEWDGSQSLGKRSIFSS